jgi:hypothetical protein
MSQRKDIRKAAAAVLRTVPAIASRVHASRTIPVNGDRPADMPCVLVYTDRDPASKVNTYEQMRELALRIVVIVRSGTDADDLLDDYCELIESVMERANDGTATPPTGLELLIDSCDYVDTALTYSGEEGRAELVHAEMTYTLRYYRTPQQTLDNFNQANIRIDMSSPRNEPQSEVAPDGQVDAAATLTLNP